MEWLNQAPTPKHMKSIQTGPRFAAAMPRRAFVKSALTAGTAAFLAPRLALGAKAAAGEKVNLACCGIGNRGAEVIRELHKTGLANIVALCHTDMGAPHTQAILKMFHDVPRFQDFRQMFDKMGQARRCPLDRPSFFAILRAPPRR